MEAVEFFKTFSYLHPFFETVISVIITLIFLLFLPSLKKIIYFLFFSIVYVSSYIVSAIFMYYLVSGFGGDEVYLVSWFIFTMY